MHFLKLMDWKTNDPVKTEDTILDNLKKNNHEKFKTIIADYHWADSINKKGIKYTQKIVDKYIKESNNKKIAFICQHISGKNINWHHGDVFSPHATLSDNFIPIPHYSCVYEKKSVKCDIDVSFVGSLETHTVRKRLHEIYGNTWLIRDTGAWHFYNQQGKKEREEYYKDVISRSKIILCPRGTGPGSIRTWEVLSSGKLPIIISDNFKLPELYENLIPVISPDNIVVLDKICQRFLNDENFLNRRLEKILKIHKDYSSNENLHKLVLEYIAKE